MLIPFLTQYFSISHTLRVDADAVRQDVLLGVRFLVAVDIDAALALGRLCIAHALQVLGQAAVRLFLIAEQGVVNGGEEVAALLLILRHADALLTAPWDMTAHMMSTSSARP